MPVKNTNFKTNQDKGKTGQEVNNQDIIKNNSLDNGEGPIFLSIAFYLAIVYFALFFFIPWGILVIAFLAHSFACYIIATILTGIGRKTGNKYFLVTSIGFYIVSILLANDPAWGVFRVIPILLTILVTVGTVMYKQDNEQDNK
ncbi:hypothetical protein [Streptococcus salivarius]|uniref:hypothetical protein n=1 Tax=Streptococcus salivarius TaxID=1304 RepID=UPI001BDAB6B3|nr:hypothetical protein [Streptococcus salivarius]MBT0913429.1 hypothetical protein [Streptococcus salivarius]